VHLAVACNVVMSNLVFFHVCIAEQVALDDKQMMQFVVNVSNEWRTVLPEYVGSLILRQLRETAEKNLSVPLHRAVMAVPAEFDERQRNYTRMAAQLAGDLYCFTLTTSYVLHCRSIIYNMTWRYGDSAGNTAEENYSIFFLTIIICTVSQKKQDTKLLPITSPNVNRFSNYFTLRFSGKFATNFYLNIPPHLNCVATLPCEISMFKKSPFSRSN